MTRADAEALVELQARSYARAGAGAQRSWPAERAMDAEAFLAFLASPPFAVLATAGADGRPHAAPFAVAVHGGAFWLALADGARLRDLRRQPYASLAVSQGGPGSHRLVLAEGAVALHGPSGELHALARRGFGEDAAWAAAFAKLRPTRLFSYR